MALSKGSLTNPTSAVGKRFFRPFQATVRKTQADGDILPVFQIRKTVSPPQGTSVFRGSPNRQGGIKPNTGIKNTAAGQGAPIPQPIRAICVCVHSRSSELRIRRSFLPHVCRPAFSGAFPNDRLSPTGSSLNAHSDGHPGSRSSARGTNPRSLVYPYA